MSAHPASMSALCAFALALFGAASPSLAADPVHDSFDRMLSESRPAVASIAVPAQPADPLVAALVLPLRDGAGPAAREDAVADSFARMLNHQPSFTHPPVPGGDATDPLIAAMVWPLLQARQLTIAGRAPRGQL